MSKKISIVMSYWNRKEQLETTLFTIQRQVNQFGHDIELILVDDGSDDMTQKLGDIINNYSFKIKLIDVDRKTKISFNPCIAYNLGLIHCSGDIIIIQNPEVCHLGNVILHALENVRDDNYIVYSVKPMLNFQQNQMIRKFVENNQDQMLIESFIQNCHDGMMDQYLEWYQHPKYRNQRLHFLSALNRNTLNKIGGFDPNFYDGVDWDDNDIRNRIERVVKSVSIHPSENVMGIHLYHLSSMSKKINYRELHLLNKKKVESNDKKNIIYCEINKYLPKFKLILNKN